MATKTNSLKILILVTLYILLSFPVTATAIPTADLDAVLLLLRANGHALFANAISTSDLLFDLLSHPSLTLLAPTDPAIFAVDMTQTPPFYLSSLRLHALPRRVSWAEFLQLPNGSSFPTLLPSHELRVTRRGFGDIFVAGTRIVMPGLYYGTHVAVHGLAGILTFRSSSNHQNSSVFIPTVNHTAVVPPIPKIPRIPTNHKNLTHSSTVNRTTFFPPVNHTTVSPVPKIPRIPTNGKNRTGSSPINRMAKCPPVLAPPPGPAGFSGYSPAESPEDRNALVGSLSGLTLSAESSPVPAPLRTKSMISRELVEVFQSGEICTVGRGE